MITIGQISKPHGVRGEVKVNPMTDDSSRFCVLKSAYVGGRLYKIESVRCQTDAVYIRFGGVSDRNQAELLRGEYITIDRAAAVPLSEGEFFVADLIGSTLVACGVEDKPVGKVLSVQSFGAADVFTVGLDNGKEMSFAFVKALNARHDSASNTLYVDADRLNEVAVYDED